MQNMLEARRLLGDFAKDIHFYSFSLTPLSDTPAELRKLMATQGIGEGWTFLTGTHENIDIARRGLGFTSRDPVEDADVTKHGGMILKTAIEP